MSRYDDEAEWENIDVRGEPPPERMDTVNLCEPGHHAMTRTRSLTGLRRYRRCWYCDLVVEESNASKLESEKDEMEEFFDSAVTMQIFFRRWIMWVMGVVLTGTMAANARNIGWWTLGWLIFLIPAYYVIKLFYLLGDLAIIDARERRSKKALDTSRLKEERKTIEEQLVELRDLAGKEKEAAKREKIAELLSLRDELEDDDGPS